MNLKPPVGWIAVAAVVAAVSLSAQSASVRAWPPPPAQARIRFVRSLLPAAVRGRPSLLARLAQTLVGAREDPRMEQPYGIAVGRDGRIYTADTFGRAIHVYDLARRGYSSIRVNGDSLIGIASTDRRLFVTDSISGRLLCLDTGGRVLWKRGPEDGFARPTGLVMGTDRLYVVDTLKHRIVIVTLDGKIAGTFGERGSGPGQFNFPTNIARGVDGRLYITDTMNFRVQVFSADGRFLSAFGRLGDGSGDFSAPKGIAVDDDGHIYVVEGVNDVVQMFDGDGQLLLVFGESGTDAGQLWLPSGIAIAGNSVYVADAANHRVQMFEYMRAGQ